MIEHKLILGGGQWLPFARSRVSSLAATGLPYASQQFEMPDGANVRVRLQPGHAFITLSGSSGGYQFFSTGPERVGEEVLGFPLYRGSAVSMSKGGKTTPVASSRLSDSASPKRWEYVPDPSDLSTHFPRGYIHQVEGIPEYAYYAKQGDGSKGAGVAPYPFLVASWSSADPLHTLAVRSGAFPRNRSEFDVGYDVAPSFFSAPSDSAPAGAGMGLAPNADYYKRAAFRKVVHPVYGARTFIVLSDISNTFHAYPVTEADEGLLEAAEAAYPGQAIKTSIPQDITLSVNAPFPGWVRNPTISGRDFAREHGVRQKLSTYVEAVPQYRWAFNSACTRACSVVFEDIAGIPLDDPGATVPQRLGSDTSDKIVESLPGMVELALDIQLTGPKIGDFSFSVTLASSIQPTVGGRFIMACGYAWQIKGMTALDDLIIAEGEIYHPSDVRISATKALSIHALKALIHVRNQRQGLVLRSFVTRQDNRLYSSNGLNLPEGAPYFEASSVFLAMDLRILAFVVQERYQEREIVPPSTVSNGATSAVQRVLVYAYNTLAKTIDMDPESGLRPALSAVFGNLSSTGMFKYPVTDVGVFPRRNAPARAGNVYASFDILATLGSRVGSAYYFSKDVLEAYGGRFNAGPYLYATKLATAFQLSHKALFAVHPNGHWSVVTDPIFYYPGPADDQMFGGKFDVSKMKQAQVDIISHSAKDGAGNASVVRSTHLDAFNKAYKTAYTRADFGYTFSVATTSVDWTDSYAGIPCRSTDTYLAAKGRTPGNYIHFLVATYSEYYPESATPRPKYPTPPPYLPTEIDANFPEWGAYRDIPVMEAGGNLIPDNFGRTSLWVIRTPAPGATSSYLAGQTPVLRGSSLFY